MDKVDSMWEHMHEVSRNGNPKKEWEISDFFYQFCFEAKSALRKIIKNKRQPFFSQQRQVIC